MSDNSTKNVFTNTSNCAIPDRQARKDLYVALGDIKIPIEGNTACPMDKHVIPKVEERLFDFGWSQRSIKLVTGRLDDLIEIIPVMGHKKRLITKIRSPFKSAVSSILETG